MKRLLFVAPSVKYGGAAKNFIGVANYAVQNGFEVHLMTEAGEEPMRYINPAIIQHYAVMNNAEDAKRRWIRCISEVRKKIREIHPDAVISFIESWRSACVLASKFTRTKCIVSERADPYSRGRKHDKLIFSIFSMADGFVFQTEQAKKYFNKRVQRKGIVIPNPVFEDDILLPYDGEKKDIIVSIARLDLKQKRQDVLISAFEKIADRYPTYVLNLYGGGPDEEKIREIASRTSCSDRINICGITRDVRRDLGEAKLMVLSSDFEGIPNAVIESMCVGVPVVSTKCSPGGAELLIENGVNGLLVECGDSDRMAEEMEKVLGDQILSDKLVQNAFSIKDKFKEGDLLKAWIKYIEEVIL
ncbi:MAG: glycosyltransferase [Oscillospiraceae bacterium]